MREGAGFSADKTLEALSREQTRLAGSIDAILRDDNKVAAMMITVLGASAFLFEPGNSMSRVLVIVAPFVIAVLAVFSLDTLREVMARGGSLRYIEERLNEMLGSEVYMWESKLVRSMAHLPAGRLLLWLVLATLLGVMGYVSAATGIAYDGPSEGLVHIATIAGWAVVGTAIVVGAIDAATAGERAYKIARTPPTGDDLIPTSSTGLTIVPDDDESSAEAAA